MKIAWIINGVVVNISDGSDLPDIGVNITDIDPQPGPGWSYDGETFSPPDRVPVVKTVTGKDVFLFLSPYWQAIYDGIPDVHRWRWDKFVTMIGLYRDTEINVTNTELTSALDGLAALGLVEQSAVNTFLGR